MSKLIKQAAVIGLGVVGMEATRTMAAGGINVLAIDKDENVAKKVDCLQKSNIVAMALDATNSEALIKSGLKEVDLVFITVKELGESISIIQNVLDLGITEIIARADDERNAKILRKVGATEVVFPEREAGIRAGNIIAARRVEAKVKDVIEFDPEISYRIEEIGVSKNMEGKTLRSLGLESKYAVKILFVKSKEMRKVKKNGEDVEEETSIQQLRPFDHVLLSNDSIIIAGEEKSINQLKKDFYG